MSWFYAFAGFAALVILHEFGHFAAAKAVGMRVERFSLFFPPHIAKIRRGETEYALGVLPFGGYVKITGMNPAEEIPPEAEHRAYYRQPVWKRVIVISAGPTMNVIIAFLILWVLYMTNGTAEATKTIESVAPRQPAAAVLKPGDRVVAVDGKTGDLTTLREQVNKHRCAGTPAQACRATTPARVTVIRDGQRRTFAIRPAYDATAERMLLGYSYRLNIRDAGPGRAARISGEDLWHLTKLTVALPARVFDSQKRKEISSVVGGYEATRQSFNFDTERAFTVLAIISLSLAVINLFPFLPLDGGHIFWALAEKIRRRPIPFAVMERASVIGFMLIILLFVIGFSNDISRLQNEGFRPR